MVKLNIICNGCKKRYSVEAPGTIGTHTFNCPYCSAPYQVTTQSSIKSKSVASGGTGSIASKVRRCEIISSIIWLVLGVIQCVLVYTAAAGVWNIINSIMALKNCKNIVSNNPNVVAYFEGRKTWIIIMAVVNLIFGAVIGVVLVLFDWYVRDYVLKNRAAFEGNV